MADPVTSDAGLSPSTARALRHRLALAQRDGRVPSVVAALARRAEPVWFGAAGQVGSEAPGAQTQYRIGSITKTMVAVCVMRLIERGALSLSDRLGDHLAGAPAADSTVVQLLSHTAGLASETPSPWWERTSGDLRSALTDVLTPEPRRHPAGERFHYSNPGFGLLGALVASIAGRPWFEMLSDEVLAPLGMTRTSYLPVAPHAEGWAVHPWADVLLPEPAHDHGLLAAAGQVWSTPSDLCRFGVFLAGDGDRILRRETLDRMRRPSVAPDDPGWTGSYGLGVQHLRFGEHVVFGHSGSMPGFQAMLCSSTDDGLTVGVQANAWSSLALGALAADLLAIVREHEPTMPLAWEPATSTLPAAVELIGPWYWGAVAMALTLRGDGDLDLAGIGARGRAARFERMPDGRWRGRNGYYAGEFLEAVRREDGTLSHLDVGSFVFTRAPYSPDDAVPDGLGLGDWQF